MKISANIKQSGPVVILTGAGISAESGIKTFRDYNGLWENHPIEEVATPEAFISAPERVHRFYNLRRQQLLTAEVRPNAAHSAIAEFQNTYPGDVTLITQNVDNLHERAGSENVLHMHGQLTECRCNNCGYVGQAPLELDSDSQCPGCRETRCLRPNIVWFGEMPFFLDHIDKRLSHAALFIAIGTSGQVYPAAGFVRQARSAGAFCVELNLLPSDNNHLFDQGYFGPASEIVGDFLQQILEST